MDKKHGKEMDKEIIHGFFGLSYANYLVIPRVVLQSMPNWWQDEFVKLINQIPEIIDGNVDMVEGYTVYPRNKEGQFVEDPLSNYERGRRRLKLKSKK